MDDTPVRGTLNTGATLAAAPDPHRPTLPHSGSVDDTPEGTLHPGATFAAAPDLDHSNPRVRRELTTWLNWLQHDVGFVGWRFDFARGYAAEFVKEYTEKTVGLGRALH